MLTALLSLALAAGPPRPPAAIPVDSAQEWSVTVAAWNVLNFGNRKAGLPPYAPLNTNLLDRYASIMSQYDIVFVEELLDTGGPLTQGVAQRPAMANYNCTQVSLPSGRAGRQERYGICYAPARIVLNGLYDYMGRQVTAVNGTQQTAQNVWMRPPYRATFTYTKPDGNPFQFSVYVSHTKPAYSAGARPPGTPANAPQNSSVHYELTSLLQNRLQDARSMFVGDLNADCASYPQAYRGQDFPAPWTWYVNYGEKTNTAPLSSCAYDRIILNDSLRTFYKAHGIYTQGINTRLDGKQVSDHYLVWVRLGGSVAKRKQLVASTSVPVTTAQRDFLGQPNPKRIRINGTNLDAKPAIASGQLFIIPYLQTAYYSGNQTYPLADVRGAPTSVTVGSDGRFTADVTWDAPVKGLYTLVLDVNRDGKYNKNDGDFVNYDNQIDLIVVDSRAGHNDVVTLGDNGQSRELFNEDVALNVYGLARNVPVNDSVDAYVVSAKLLPPGFSWLNPPAGFALASVSVPVNRPHGPILVSQLTPADMRRRLRTSPEGTLFASAWERPYELMNTPVYTTVPPVPDYKPEYAVDDSTLRDPCEDAWKSTDLNFQQVCNVGNLFSDYYGNSFNVVLDVNRNGVFDGGDKVDVHDIGDMTTFFSNPANTVLDQRANGNPAVGEYKEYLDAKLNLSTPLPDNNTYDTATSRASTGYMCTPGVARTRFPLIQQGAQVGFKMLNQADYLSQKSLGSQIYSYAQVDMSGNTVSNSTGACVASGSVSIEGLTVQSGARAVVIADQQKIQGNVTMDKNSTACLVAGQALGFASGTAIIAVADPEPVSKVAFAVFAGAQALIGGAASVACALTQ
ncbi:MAG: hypothetical protein JO040_15575 [Gemmatimonadetes bacterium]|nr:hypothetical protein [Gemmatimonadota bacterium]